MRFIVDESVGPSVAAWLGQQNHQVFSVYDEARGMSDDDILDKAASEDWILITTDKDFGEMIYRDQHLHSGVVLLRLEDERSAMKIEVLKKLLGGYSERLAGRYVVVTQSTVRFAAGPGGETEGD